jgi:hypothetical protein
VYAGSALLMLRDDGCVMVLVGHCTRKDWAAAGIAATKTRGAKSQRVRNILLAMRPPNFAFQKRGAPFASLWALPRASRSTETCSEGAILYRTAL